MTKIKNNGSNLRRTVPRFFKISNVANFLNVSTRTVRRWIKEGLLVPHRINGVVRISETDLAAFLAAFRDR
jgi:excisionase family DNA binding protein